MLLGAVVCAHALLFVFVTQVDYQGNYAATDSDWFYRNLDGSYQNPPVGGGVYPTIEYDSPQSFQSPGRVVYHRGTPIQVRFRFYNHRSVTVSGTWTFVTRS